VNDMTLYSPVREQTKIDIDGVSARFPGRSGSEPVSALDSASPAVRSDEFITILGPSGCGKSTLLFTILKPSVVANHQ
jgi:ABC-type sugar transport system ATPase subunit